MAKKIIENTCYSVSELTKDTFPQDWMKNIPDECLISEISIPGTHDSIASLNGIPNWALCQSLTLQCQMNVGIRYFDIRCRLVEDQILIYHSTIYLECSFLEILQQMITFLKQFKSEFLILRVKNEGYSLPKNNLHKFSEKIKLAFNQFSHDLFWFQTGIPKLKYVRSKLVIVQNFESDQIFGIPYELLNISDLWSTDHVGDKMESVISHLKLALTEAEDKNLFLTHSSCTGHLLESGKSPKDLANEINPLLFEFIKKKKGRFGIIAMDFPSNNLVSEILYSNCKIDFISKL